MSLQSKPIPKICSRCGKGFQCGTREAHGGCWCELYPILPIKTQADCMCSDCLAQATLLAPDPEEKK